MKANHSKLWLALSLMLAMGCGARTPLDDWETEQPAGPAAGGATSQSGGATGTSTSDGGSLATGGQGDGGARGGQVATGGTGGQVATGGAAGQVATGGRGGSGGTPPSGGSVIGGRGGSGGTPPSGGAVVGGRGGSGGTPPPGGAVVGGRGGPGGTPLPGGAVVGGRGGPGGTPASGGSLVAGRTGGRIPSGGTVVGGRGGSGGTPPSGGSVVGGRGGTPVSGGTSATGGGGAAGSGGTTSCLGLAPNEELIDDMNDGDRFIPQVNGRAGAWADSDDGTPGATMFPDPAGPFTMTDTGDACRKYAAYVHGGPFVDQGAYFRFGLGSPYNASAYTGISFWAKIDSGTSSGLRIAFPDKDTQPDGGLCQANVTSGPTQCYDHYGKRITNIATGWAKYFVDFSSLSQDGWGRLGAGFDPATLYEVQFQIPVDAKFGIWIDDVAFTSTPILPL